MSYNHYQNNLPGWGTSQFQFGPPPAPSFQPQSSWGGMDYYNAHAPNPRPEIYQYAMNRLMSGAGPLGVGMHEARHWHRRAYGGVGDITRMLPSEIGHAAGYEAFRSWLHKSPVFRILDGNLERQKEVLISLAIAEAAHLWEASGRGYDQYALQTASETAAATASLVFSQTMDLQSLGGDYHRARGSQYYPNAGDAYAVDDNLLMSRQQQLSMSGGMGPGMSGGAGMGMGGMGMGGGMMNRGMMGGGMPRPLSAEPMANRFTPSPYIGGSPLPQAGASPYVGGVGAGMGGVGTGAGGFAPGVGGFAPGMGGMGGMGGGVGGVAGSVGGMTPAMGGGYPHYGSSISSTYPGIENARPTTTPMAGQAGYSVAGGPLGGTYGGRGMMGSAGYAAPQQYMASGYGGYGGATGGYGGAVGGYGGAYGQQTPTIIIDRSGRDHHRPHHHHHHHRKHRSLSRTRYY